MKQVNEDKVSNKVWLLLRHNLRLIEDGVFLTTKVVNKSNFKVLLWFMQDKLDKMAVIFELLTKNSPTWDNFFLPYFPFEVFSRDTQFINSLNEFAASLAHLK